MQCSDHPNGGFSQTAITDSNGHSGHIFCVLWTETALPPVLVMEIVLHSVCASRRDFRVSSQSVFSAMTILKFLSCYFRLLLGLLGRICRP